MSAFDEDADTVMNTPVVEHKPSTQYIDKRTQHEVRDNDVGNYRSAMVNTRHTDVSSLLTHVHGSSLIVDYYKSLLDSDDEATPHSFDQDGAYQQYSKIVALELKVQTPIDPSQYSEEGDSFSATGVAIIYCGLKPNVADLFLTDIGDGRIGLVTITKATPLSYLKNAVYSIEYRIHKFLDDKIQKSLDEKTVNTFYFDIDDLRKGGSGLLTERQVVTYERLEKALIMLSTYHMTTFHDSSSETLSLPTGNGLLYDPYIPGVMRDILDIDILTDVPRNRELNCVDPDDAKKVTLWDVLLENCIEQLPIVCSDLTTKDVEEFPKHPQFISVRYSGVSLVNVLTLPTETEETASRGLEELSELFEETKPEVVPPVNTVKVRKYPIHDGGYIFSKHFYNQDWDKMSQLESLVTNYLDNKVINVETLVSFIKEVMQWTKEEQFYLIPVLIILGNVAQKQKSVS